MTRRPALLRRPIQALLNTCGLELHQRLLLLGRQMVQVAIEMVWRFLSIDRLAGARALERRMQVFCASSGRGTGVKGGTFAAAVGLVTVSAFEGHCTTLSVLQTSCAAGVPCWRATSELVQGSVNCVSWARGTGTKSQQV